MENGTDGRGDMAGELREGVELYSIAGQQGSQGDQIYHTTNPQMTGHADRIVVSEQCGQMGMVPWARVEYGKEVVLVNLALMEEVILKGE